MYESEETIALASMKARIKELEDERAELHEMLGEVTLAEQDISVERWSEIYIKANEELK